MKYQIKESEISNFKFEKSLCDEIARIFPLLSPDVQRKARKRKMQIFCAICYAHKMLRIPYIQEEFSSKLELQKEEITSAYGMYRTIGLNYRINSFDMKCQDLIPLYCEKIGLECSDLYKFVEKIINNDSERTLNSKKPGDLAASFVALYGKKIGLEFNLETYSELMYVNLNMIKKIMGLIESINDKL